ncbi:MAG: YkgJ family cysteine cluster protein [Planctomycetota bacterium]
MEQPWYADGLRFACTRCGHCCTGEPGNVWISEDEIHALAERLGMDQAGFRRRYTVQRRKGISLRERPNHDCVFWDRQQGCTAYDLRPRQCRTWPFWRCNIASPQDWQEAAADCPGIGRGPVHDMETIRETAAADGLP